MLSREEARAQHAPAQSHLHFLSSSWYWTGSVCLGWGASNGGGEHTSEAWMCLPRDSMRQGRIPIAHIWSGSSSYKPPALAGCCSCPPHLWHEQPHGHAARSILGLHREGAQHGAGAALSVPGCPYLPGWLQMGCFPCQPHISAGPVCLLGSTTQPFQAPCANDNQEALQEQRELSGLCSQTAVILQGISLGLV